MRRFPCNISSQQLHSPLGWLLLNFLRLVFRTIFKHPTDEIREKLRHKVVVSNVNYLPSAKTWQVPRHFILETNQEQLKML